MSERRQKSVKITQLNEDAVIQHILPLSELSLENKKKKNDIAKPLFYSPSCSDKPKRGYADRYSSDSDDENAMCVPSAHTQDTEMEGDAIFGGELFKFRTHKKSGQMAMKASDCVSPKTPKTPTSNKNTPNSGKKGSKLTPKQGRSKGTPNEGSGTPTESSPSLSSNIGEASSRTHKRMESSTPYRLRKRNQDLEEEGSSSDNSVDESEEDEDDDDDKGREAVSHGDGGLSNMTSTAEAYFALHCQTSVTSDHTMANLEGPRMDVAAVREALKGVDMGHKKEMKVIKEKHEAMFNKWMLNMCHGYNVLLYGLGSKRSLLDSLRTSHIDKFSHVVVNGYFPSLTVKHILTSITEDILEETQSFSNPQAHLKFIKDSFRVKDIDWFLVVHNIDGLLLRSDKAQGMMSHLAEVTGCHIVASIDHINAPFLWDQN